MARQRKKPVKAHPRTSKRAKAGADAPPAGDERKLEVEMARQLLERAFCLIDEKCHWTRQAFARDRHSHPVSPSSERAFRFCPGGALLRAASELLGLRLAANAKEQKLAEMVADVGDLTPPAVTTAYRFLARAFELLLLQPAGGHIREQRMEDGSLQPVVIAPAARIATGKDEETRMSEDEVEQPTTWPRIVHGYNDHPAVKHGVVRLAFIVAHALAYLESSEETPSPKPPSEPKDGKS